MQEPKTRHAIWNYHVLKEADRIEWSMLSLSVLTRIIRLTEFASYINEGIIEYRKAHDQHATNLDLYAVELERYRIKKAQRTLENSAKWVSARVRRMKALLDQMPQSCASYLEAFRDTHRYDGLFTGRQKTLAPGRALPIFEVTSEPEPEPSTPPTRALGVDNPLSVWLGAMMFPCVN